jgi:hypothetical protein
MTKEETRWKIHIISLGPWEVRAYIDMVADNEKQPLLVREEVGT